MSFDKEIWLSNSSVAPGNVFGFELDLASGQCRRSPEPADPASVEFPTVHPYRYCDTLLQVNMHQTLAVLHYYVF